MQFFLDTANLQEIRDGARSGILDGITTNPSLAAKEKRPFRDVLKEICSIVSGPVSAEVTATTTEAMLGEGRELAAVAPNVVVKVPLTPDGIRAVTLFRRDNIKVNVTLCFSAVQALLAAKAGATYVSPFVGRLDDRGQDGMDLITDMRRIFTNYRFETKILVASIRHPIHVHRAALAGADVSTMPYAVFEKLYQHPLTDTGLKAFLDDWKKLQDQTQKK